jgi:uncharacterized membrane protein
MILILAYQEVSREVSLTLYCMISWGFDISASVTVTKQEPVATKWHALR